ncbi:hypothetical protein [Paenibacillus xanthanilyticus]|uniref:Phage tail protein n=1 Tax=Paenibacillus xanthanilyticus TaxID=1783531 RepID=A0ABV8KC98_9BACL
MASDLTKIKLGPCKVTFDVGGTSPVVFETTKGGVVLNYEQTTREVTVDQFGNTAVKELVLGHSATVEVPFAEFDLDKLAKIIPGATLTTNGTTPEKKRVDVNATTVIDLFSVAKELKIEPLSTTATANDAVTLYKAAPRPNLNYTYSYEGELITNVTFKGYPDADGNIIGFGDQTA